MGGSNWQEMTDLVSTACLATFSEEIIYEPYLLNPMKIDAIFDNEFESIDPNTGATVISTQPMIGVKNSHLPRGPEKGDIVIIRGKRYRVIETQTDGQAMSRLMLNVIE